MKDKNFTLIVVLLLAATVAGWSLYFKKYLQEDTVNIAVFPKEISSWASEDLPISKLDYAVLETHNVFVRRYKNPEAKEAYLFIVYSQHNRKVSHPPEVCYAGAGVTISGHSRDIVPVPSANLVVDVNKLVLSKGDAKQVALYWFKVGDSFTASYWKQQILVAIKTLLGKPAGSALIRVSVDVHTDEAVATGEAKKFAALVIPEIIKTLP